MFRGQMVMDGYFGNEAATRPSIEPDGWLHSGDIATMDEDGYVVRKPGRTVTAEAVVAHCREHLAAYKVPRAVQFVDEVPITASGKIMRRLLKDIDDGTR